MKLKIANEEHSDRLSVIVPYPTSVSGIIDLLRQPIKLKFARSRKNRR